MAGTGGATIVVLEESAAVQELIDQALRQTGDRVLVTQNPLEVLDVARRVRIDLLVTQLVVDDSRPSLVDEVRSSQPNLRVPYISDEGTENLVDDVTVSTPFCVEELRKAVAALLEPG